MDKTFIFPNLPTTQCNAKATFYSDFRKGKWICGNFLDIFHRLLKMRTKGFHNLLCMMECLAKQFSGKKTFSQFGIGFKMCFLNMGLTFGIFGDGDCFKSLKARGDIFVLQNKLDASSHKKTPFGCTTMRGSSGRNSFSAFISGVGICLLEFRELHLYLHLDVSGQDLEVRGMFDSCRNPNKHSPLNQNLIAASYNGQCRYSRTTFPLLGHHGSPR